MPMWECDWRNGNKIHTFFSSNNFVFKIQYIWRNQMIDFVKTNKVNELKDKWQSAHGMPSDFLSPTRFGRSFQHLCLNFLNTLCLQKDVNRTLSSVFFLYFVRSCVNCSNAHRNIQLRSLSKHFSSLLWAHKLGLCSQWTTHRRHCVCSVSARTYDNCIYRESCTCFFSFQLLLLFLLDFRFAVVYIAQNINTHCCSVLLLLLLVVFVVRHI